jgi:hypothetical protein
MEKRFLLVVRSIYVTLALWKNLVAVNCEQMSHLAVRTLFYFQNRLLTSTHKIWQTRDVRATSDFCHVIDCARRVVPSTATA